MIRPIISKIDESEVSRLKNNLPHALIIKSESGLDTQTAIDYIIASEDTDKFLLQFETDKKHISVQQIRDMIYSFRTQATRRRVVIVHLAEQMTEESQNALLKILEEPSDRLHFILETHSTSLLLPTIISRCETMTLHRTSIAQDREILQKSAISEQSIQQILFLAAGRPKLIEQLINDSGLLDRYRDYAASAKLIMSGTSYEALTGVQRHSASRENAIQLLDVLTTLVRFQTKSKGVGKQTIDLLNRLELAESSLKNNGNIKLSLLNIVL